VVWRRTGHASQTIVVYPPTGSTAYEREMSTPPTLLRSMTLLYLTFTRAVKEENCMMVIGDGGAGGSGKTV